MRKSAIGILAVMVGMAAVSAPVKSNVAGNEIGRNGAPLPYDAEVEYLQSSGTQWIDTGYTSAHQDEVLSATINNYDQIDTPQAIFSSWGGDVSSERLQLFKTSGRIGGNFVTFQVPGSKIVAVVADLPNRRFVIDGVQYSSPGMTAPRISLPILLLARHDLTVHGVVLLYGFSISRSANTVMDLAPVRFTNENGQSEGAMYDRVTGQLFRNQGAGTFIIGPDK